MNKGQNVRRGRTRHTPNKGGGSSNNGTGNRVDSKSRGNPQQNLDKYLGMARDALQAGDRVNEEYYLQFAEHFQRVINDRAQEEDNRKDRSKNNNNNNRNRNPNQNPNPNPNQSRPSNDMKDEGQKVVDPAAQDQPKIAIGDEDKPAKVERPEPAKQDKPKTEARNEDKSANAKRPEPAKQDDIPSGDKPKPRVARKRAPRVKADAVSEQAVPVKVPEAASPEIKAVSGDKAAE